MVEMGVSGGPLIPKRELYGGIYPTGKLSESNLIHTGGIRSMHLNVLTLHYEDHPLSN